MTRDGAGGASVVARLGGGAAHSVNTFMAGERAGVPSKLLGAGHRSQTVERIGVVALRLSNNRELEVHDEGVVLVNERQVDIDTLSHTRIGELRPDPVTVGGIRQAPLKGGQVVRARVF